MNEFGCFVIECEEGDQRVTYVVSAKSLRGAVGVVQRHPGPARRILDSHAIAWPRAWEVERTARP